MNILVTGANGQLGREMRIVSTNSSDKFIFTDVNRIEGLDTTYLDICNPDAIRQMVRDHSIDIIVNCAAYTNVDAAESNEPIAERLNAEAPGYLARAIKEVQGLLIHISTDYVFGKEPYNTPCKEDQTGTPTGAYGRTKLHGEQAINNTGCDSVIIRTAWLYSEFGKNFCKTMLSLTDTKPALNVVFDQVGTPTYALDLANAIITIIEDYKAAKTTKTAATAVEAATDITSYPNAGIYHFSNEGVCSWFDFTKMIAEYSGHTACDIRPCHSEEFPSPVKRPSYSVLDKTKIKSTFGITIPYWTDSLKKCITNLQQA